MIDKSGYNNIKIPDKLDSVVQSAIDEALSSKKRFTVLKKVLCTAAALFIAAVSMLNLSPSFAQAVSSIPVISDLCSVFTFREYHFEDDIKYIDVKIPQISNTGQSELEKRVNLEIQKVINDCVEENEARAKEYYDAFVATGGDPEDFHPVGILVDYEVKSVNEDYVSFVVWECESSFSAYTQYFYYNIDLENGAVITLKDYLGSDYREKVTQSVEKSIAEWDEDEKYIFFDDISIYDLINENRSFYINEEGKIVVVFDKYEIACGAAGVLEFVIES